MCKRFFHFFAISFLLTTSAFPVASCAARVPGHFLGKAERTQSLGDPHQADAWIRLLSCLRAVGLG